MSELIDKAIDAANLKGIGGLLALPMLCVAYILQTGLEVNIWSFTLVILDSDDGFSTVAKFIFIFISKSLFISFWAAVVTSVIRYTYAVKKWLVLYFISVFLIGFALLGIFGSNEIGTLKDVESFWFYACFMWGLYFHGMKEKIDNEKKQWRTQKIVPIANLG